MIPTVVVWGFHRSFSVFIGPVPGVLCFFPMVTEEKGTSYVQNVIFIPHGKDDMVKTEGKGKLKRPFI